ncbi:MAG: hypothetical protein GWN99_01035 [Gemmatimonadetes bacterium]|nr:hypothetical protein [Gemmatimonadota bacterium]
MRVKAKVRPLPVVATVLGWSADSLFLDPVNGPELRLPLATLESLEVSRGQKSKVVTGAVVGLAVGAAAAGSFLSVFCSDSDTVCESDEVFRALAVIVPPPTAVGALIGLAVRVERWESVPLHVGTAFQRADGWRVSVSWTF